MITVHVGLSADPILLGIFIIIVLNSYSLSKVVMAFQRGYKRRAKHHRDARHATKPTQTPPTTRKSVKSGLTARCKRFQAQRPSLLALIPQLILASMNVDGLSPETEWAVDTMLSENQYDVSINPPFSFLMSDL